MLTRFKQSWIELHRVAPKFAEWLIIHEEYETIPEMIEAAKKLNFNKRKDCDDKLIGKYIKCLHDSNNPMQMFGINPADFIILIKDVFWTDKFRDCGFGEPKWVIDGIILQKDKGHKYSGLIPDGRITEHQLFVSDKVQIMNSCVDFDRRVIEIIGKNYLNKLVKL